ncbi:hypothetical protein ACJIZ3_005858 [Penstemon smallii]|uniref:Protein kinase domain-containing protein n=1 Tax=Penstemon smallii TaxID=265156 RepID=A0ABD3S639_9LAMI
MSFLLGISRILFIFLLFCSVNSIAQSSTSSCPSSSCGNIPIRYPFRLKGDPISCGYNRPGYVLDCLNNRTTIFTLNSIYYYHVLELNYEEFTIRLITPGINRKNLSSCPVYSNEYHDFYSDFNRSSYDFLYEYHSDLAVWFVHCVSPVSSSRYLNAPFCGISSNSSEIHSYVMSGYLYASDLEDSCTIDRAYFFPTRLRLSDNSSLATIYDALAYGFDVHWLGYTCDYTALLECNRRNGDCFTRFNYAPVCEQSCYIYTPVISFVLYCEEDIQHSQLFSKCQFKCRGIKAGIYGAMVVVSILVLKLLCGFPFLIGLVVYKWRRRHLSMDQTIEDFLQGQNNLTPIKYTYSEIKKMTRNFNQKLGEGGYGTVYKGKLRSDPYVAIKMLDQSVANVQEFISEVGTIGRIHHFNIVQLIGFCVEGSKCALVYEYLANGSLDKYLFGQRDLALRYSKIFEIALGVARGIDYLHRGCDMQILHFDIKPHNILLDEKFNPKISDFGLAQLYPTDNSFISLKTARGTMGYMAPEMFYKNIGGVSYKADVYSFGMLLMEMAGRRKNMNPFAEDESQIYYPLWVYDQIYAGNEIEIVDANDEERKIVKKIIIVALWCIQMRPSDRPSMNKVVEMFEGDSELQMPPKPFLAPREIAEDHGTSESPLV